MGGSHSHSPGVNSCQARLGVFQVETPSFDFWSNQNLKSRENGLTNKSTGMPLYSQHDTVGNITLISLAVCALLTVHYQCQPVPFSSLCHLHPASLELPFTTMPTPPKGKSSGSRKGIDFVQCSNCCQTWDYASRNMCYAHIARANKSGASTKRMSFTSACAGAKVLLHYYKQTMKTAIGGTAYYVEDTQAPPTIPASPAKAEVTDPYIPVTQYQYHDEGTESTDTAMQDCSDCMDAVMAEDGTDPELDSSTTRTKWKPGDMNQCLLAMRSSSHLRLNPGDGALTDLVRRLLHDGSMASTYSAAQAQRWTDAQIVTAQKAYHLLMVQCFTADAKKHLLDLQDKTQITQSQQMIMDFCLRHSLSQGTSENLVALLQDPRMNLEDMKGKTYKTLHKNIKDNIPDEYAFRQLELYVGKLYGLRVPVSDTHGKTITVPVRCMFPALLLLYADIRYKGVMYLVPNPSFRVGPNGQKERDFCGFDTCEPHVHALNGPPVIISVMKSHLQLLALTMYHDFSFLCSCSIRESGSPIWIRHSPFTWPVEC